MGSTNDESEIEVSVAQERDAPALKKVGPYHAVGAHWHRGVYHDRADCPEGQRIHSDHLDAGTGGRPLCDECRALAEQVSVPPAG